MMKGVWQAEIGVFLGLWLLLMTAGRSALLHDPGTFWHTVVGQRILATGSLIRSDPFSFTFAHERWISRQWIGECVMALLHGIGGLDSLLLATASLVAGLFAWISYRLRRVGFHWLLATLVVCLAMAAGAFHILARPHLATLVLLALTFAWLCDFEAGRMGIGRLFWLVPVFILWTNAHDGMVGGLGTVVLAVTGWSGAYLLGKPSPVRSSRQLAALYTLVILCGLTMFLNPFGAELPRVWFSLVRSSTVHRIMLEHQPLLSAPAGWFFLVSSFGVVYAFVLAGLPPKWPRVTWVLPVVWFYLSWTRARHGPLFAVTGAVALAEMFPHTRWARWLTKRGSDLFQPPGKDDNQRRPPHGGRLAFLPVALIGTALLLQGIGARVPILGRGWAKLDRNHWPVELLADLRRYDRDQPAGTRVFNEMLFGGFLIYHTPRLRVFIDDRCELYGDEWLLAYVDAVHNNPAQIDRWVETYGFELALVETGKAFDAYLRDAGDWTVIRESAAATLYRRIESRQRVTDCGGEGSASDSGQ